MKTVTYRCDAGCGAAEDSPILPSMWLRLVVERGLLDTAVLQSDFCSWRCAVAALQLKAEIWDA